MLASSYFIYRSQSHLSIIVVIFVPRVRIFPNVFIQVPGSQLNTVVEIVGSVLDIVGCASYIIPEVVGFVFGSVAISAIIPRGPVAAVICTTIHISPSVLRVSIDIPVGLMCTIVNITNSIPDISTSVLVSILDIPIASYEPFLNSICSFVDIIPLLSSNIFDIPVISVNLLIIFWQ
jgi:hypothetical protein